MPIASGRLRWIALLLSITLVPAFVGFYTIVTDRAYKDALFDGQREADGVAASVTEQLSRALETTDLVLIDIATRIADDEAPWESGRVALRLRELPQVRALLVTDKAGIVRHASVPNLVGFDLADRGWLATVTRGVPRLVVGNPEAGRYLATPGQTVQEARRWTIPLARAIDRPGEGVEGAAIALLNPDYMIQVAQRAAADFDVIVRFRTLDGTLLAASDAGSELIGRANRDGWMYRRFLPLRDHGGQDGIDSGGVDAMSSFAVTSTGNIVVEVSRPRWDVVAPAERRSWELAVGLLIVALTTLGMLITVSRVGMKVAREQLAARNAEVQREAAEREAASLLRSRSEMQRLLGGLPALIFRADLHTGGAYVLTLLGGNVEGVTGWPADALVTEDDWHQRLDPGAPPFGRFLDRVRETGEGRREYRLRQPDGTWRWLRTVAMVLDHRPGGTTEIVGHIADITAEREADARLAAAGRLTSLGEMATGLAHELRQPLAIMSTVAENMIRALKQNRTELLPPRAERIVEQARRASHIIEHLRRFARGTGAGAPVEAFGLEGAVEGAMVLAGGTLQSAGVELTITLGDPPPRVLGHQVALEQVLVNLMTNAAQAMQARPDDQPRRLLLLARLADGQVLITVRDTGGGIAPEVMARLFEPFITTKPLEQGTGLGLSICHGLMRAMGGAINAHNEPDGAVFELTLPLAPAEVPASA